jgi:predicted nucleic acid-binding protein
MKDIASDGGLRLRRLRCHLESLARRRNLTAYDAADLDLAQRSNLVLATSDDPLRQAAIAEGIALLV